MTDPRPLIFSEIAHARVSAAVVADGPGLVMQTSAASTVATEIGLTIEDCVADGQRVTPGTVLMRVTGSPIQIALAEERLIGIMAKPSGIATAARQFVDAAAGRLRIVSGAWKKLPLTDKEMLRAAISSGGASARIAEWPFVYLDKNFVTMLGGVQATMEAVAAQRDIDGYRRVVQVTNVPDAIVAARGGAGIIFVDTGRIADAAAAARALCETGLRSHVELAFGGGVELADVEALAVAGVDIADIGRAIVDAPLLDMSIRVLNVSAVATREENSA